jgi:N-formylglutamate amidohydrolase
LNRRPKSSPALLPLALAAWMAGFAPADTRAAEGNSVSVESGNLPLILTAPHGGGGAIDGVPAREGKGVRQFNRKSDWNTARVAEALADALEKKLGERPYVVIARFHRRYIDANRPARDAYETPAAKATYDAYHAAIVEARRDVAARWGRGLLLDIHGQAMLPDAVIRGTRNGKTTSALIDRFGRKTLIGENSLFGQLAGQGFKVVPPVGSDDREVPSYNGGHTVQTYGSGDGGSIDAIQLELGRKLREAGAIGKTAEGLANAIAAFAKDHLPAAEPREGDRGR